MTTARSLPHRLRLEAVIPDALELLSEVSARLINAFWTKSRHVDVRPMVSSTGYGIHVAGKRVATLSCGGLDGGLMRPCVIVEVCEDREAFSDPDEALAKLTEIVEKGLTTTAGQDGGKE